MKAKTSKAASQIQSMGVVGDLVRKEMARQFPALKREQRHVFRLALNEAEALAWETSIPLLVFPLIAFEKLQLLDQWNERQKLLKSHPSAEIALAA